MTCSAEVSAVRVLCRLHVLFVYVYLFVNVFCICLHVFKHVLYVLFAHVELVQRALTPTPRTEHNPAEHRCCGRLSGHQP